MVDGFISNEVCKTIVWLNLTGAAENAVERSTHFINAECKTACKVVWESGKVALAAPPMMQDSLTCPNLVELSTC